MIEALLMILFFGAIYVAFRVLNKTSDGGMLLKDRIEGSTVDPDHQALSLGDEGKAISRLSPVGMAEFSGKEVEVTCRDGFTEEGSILRIVRLEQGRITVRIINNQ